MQFSLRWLHKREKPVLCHLEHISSGDVDAGLDATEAHDTSVKPLPDERRSIFDMGTSLFSGGNSFFSIPNSWSGFEADTLRRHHRLGNPGDG